VLLSAPSPSPTAAHRRSRGRRPCLHRAAPRPDLASSLPPSALPPATSPAGKKDIESGHPLPLLYGGRRGDPAPPLLCSAAATEVLARSKGRGEGGRGGAGRQGRGAGEGKEARIQGEGRRSQRRRCPTSSAFCAGRSTTRPSLSQPSLPWRGGATTHGGGAAASS
jgi:hypothetical protein